MTKWYESSDPRLFRAVVCGSCNEITVWDGSERCHLCGENIKSKTCTTCKSLNIVYLPQDFFQYIACLDCGVRDESGLEVSGLEMKNVEFFKCNLQDSIWDGCWIDIGDFRSANLSRAIIDSWFSDCDFSGATLLELKQESRFGPSLINCNFTGATLAGSDLSRCDFSGSTFNRADLSNACFDLANLSNVDLRDAIIDGATFEDAILEGTIFPASYSRTTDSSSKARSEKGSKDSEPGMREDYMRDEPF